MNPRQLSENVFWTGGIDWNLRDFHGYTTNRGSSYNSYLVKDEKIVLIDTVKHYLFDEMLSRISKIAEPSKIDYIISNHVEMDHSGSIPKLLEIAKNAVVITSPMGEKGLRSHFGDIPMKVVKTGDTFSSGKMEFTFVQTPMVHWPDNMVTYLKNEKILFSNDAFGQHIASTERTDQEYPLEIAIEEAKKYYANIVLPYSEQVKKAMEALKGLEIEMIAPSHGIAWKSRISEILKHYEKWSSGITSGKALIIYDTMWDSTKKMAYAVMSGFEEAGIPSEIVSVKNTDISDIMTKIMESEYVCVGSPTLNRNMLPTVSAFLTYMKGLSPKKRKGLAFGSYGWGGESISQVEGALKEAGFEMLESIKMQYIPGKEDLEGIKNKIKGAVK